MEIELTEPIIQHIQSLLFGTKDAARTAILSKSWYSAWSTRPSLHFDQRTFTPPAHFADSIATTLQRYKQSNLKLHRFDLSLTSPSPSLAAAADQFIIDALSLGLNHLSLHIDRWYYALPLQVFDSSSLINLSLVRCKIGCLTLVRCPRLSLLSLKSVSVEGDEVMDAILMGCPLIEDIKLSGCIGLTKLDFTSKMHYLRMLHVDHHNNSVWPLSVRFFGECSATSVLPEFRLLTSLVLRNVSLGDGFFDQFLVKFPSLEHFVLDSPSEPFEHLDIAVSHSLKFLGLRYCWRLKSVKVNVPRISKFEYVGVRSSVPSLSFNTDDDSRDWESRINFISCHFEAMKLREFLKELSCSRISLRLQCCSAGSVITAARHIQDYPIPVVADLMIRGRLTLPQSCAFLKALFWNCRPVLITQEFDAFSDLQCLYETLKQHVNPEYLTSPENSPTRHNLVDFSIEFFEGMKWQSVDWDALLDAWNPENGRQFRFRLQWSSIPEL